MKYLNLTLVLFLSMCVGLQAQTTSQPWAIGIGGASLRDATDVPFGDFKDDDNGLAIQLQIARSLNSSFNLALNSGISFKNVEQRDADDVSDIDLLLQYRLDNGYIIKEDYWFAPYLQAGIGGNFLDFGDIDMNYHVPVGAGIRFRLDQTLSLDLNATYKPSISDATDYMSLNGGLIARLGAGKNKDSDKDGIIDLEDACPYVAGTAATQGCPDRDGDGVADNMDVCPDTPGTIKGCPDSDGDGIADKEDLCPEVAGIEAFLGCPDTDGDGIKDSDDACPNVAGLKELSGCPDADGDGVRDSEDACPELAGLISLKGCPDTDGDGVADPDDDCPEVAGLAEFNGCVDTDGDGIRDLDDRCPEEAGVEALKGCPEIEEEVQEKLDLATRSVRFASGSDKLLSRSYNVLNEVAQIMKDYPQYKLRISGYTDSSGDDQKNLELSQRRARSCKNYLIGKEVAASRMVSDGFGEVNPVASNSTSAGRAQNRRVEFELYVD